ncbi:hypothetical protein LZ554_005516 [Drepanopeziza brunnea f. sp. 'monogermtubi']|nr:hypothetical protein LZ554_005516 [Drepanopeziza brunnea f. sp. 'monogermtubi']
MGKARTEATRAERKAKKRAAEDQIPDVPDAWTAEPEVEKAVKKEDKKRKRDVAGEDEEATPINGGEKESKKERKKRRKEAGGEGGTVEDSKVVKEEKKVKKEKKAKVEEESAADVEMADAPVDGEPKKSKKERKAERKAKEAAEAAANTANTAKSTTATAPVLETNGKKKPSAKGEAAEEKTSKKNNRNREKKRKGKATGANGEAVEGQAEESHAAPKFIVFVGNLPFTANTASITKHFASIKPKSVRALTEKENPTKSRGIAFVEFENYDHMKTCLKLFHHSMFDDGKSAPRQINCELTAGGGGNTKARKEKISDKNIKLNEERARRIAEEKTAKLAKQAEGGGKKLELGEDAIHPSRRRQVPS